MEVYFVAVQHADGLDYEIFHSEERAKQWLLTRVEEWWRTEVGGPPTSNPDEAIKDYFNLTEESFILEARWVR